MNACMHFLSVAAPSAHGLQCAASYSGSGVAVVVVAVVAASLCAVNTLINIPPRPHPFVSHSRIITHCVCQLLMRPSWARITSARHKLRGTCHYYLVTKLRTQCKGPIRLICFLTAAGLPDYQTSAHKHTSPSTEL